MGNKPIVISIILTTLILFSSVRMTFTYIYYELDPVGFIEQYCENKDKPELQCNGKCHLKKVAEKSTDNKQEPAKSTTLKDLTLFFAGTISYSFFTIKDKKHKNFEIKNLYVFTGISPIDPPPKV